MLLVFSGVAEIALVASENTLDITDPYSFTPHNFDKITMYNINQTYHFSQHNPAINITSRYCRETIKLLYRTYRQCSEMN